MSQAQSNATSISDQDQFVIYPRRADGSGGALDLWCSAGLLASFAGASTARVVVSNAALLALNTTIVPVVAAPGAGKLIVPLLTAYNLVYNSVPFVPSPNPAPPTGGAALFYGSAAGQQVSLMDTALQPFVSGLAPASAITISYATGNGYSTADIVNQAVVLAMTPGSALVDGDSSGIVTFKYIILDV